MSHAYHLVADGGLIIHYFFQVEALARQYYLSLSLQGKASHDGEQIDCLLLSDQEMASVHSKVRNYGLNRGANASAPPKRSREEAEEFALEEARSEAEEPLAKRQRLLNTAAPQVGFPAKQECLLPTPVLTADTVCAYVRKTIKRIARTNLNGPRPWKGDTGFLQPFVVLDEIFLSAHEIHGGNLNYAFCVRSYKRCELCEQRVHSKLFVKQAPDYVKCLGPEALMARERHLLEMEAYGLWKSKFREAPFPRIFSVDSATCTTIMEFLDADDGWELLHAGLMTIAPDAGVEDSRAPPHDSGVALRSTGPAETLPRTGPRCDNTHQNPVHQLLRVAGLLGDALSTMHRGTRALVTRAPNPPGESELDEDEDAVAGAEIAKTSSDDWIAQEENRDLVEKFRNPACRALQKRFVYERCYEETEAGKKLMKEEAFRKELTALKDLYLLDLAVPPAAGTRGEMLELSSHVFALLHGDLHAGSVM